jgi:heptosyltransferase-2
MWISFNYFPKQIHDAKTFDSCKLNPGQNIFWFTWGDLRGFIGILNQCNVIVGNDGGANEYGKSIRKPSLLSSLDWKENLGYIRENPSPISTFEWLQTELLSQKTEKNLNRMLLPYIKNLNLRYLKRNLNLSIEHSIKLTIKRNTNGIAAIKHF